MRKERLVSVGIDIGTTTTQLVFSRLTVENAATAFTVPRFAITKKEILFRSRIHFTPLVSEREIHVQKLRDIVKEEYAAAGISRGDIQTGAVIITGETARKENARQVLEALSGFAGDFVVATAGPRLESLLAGKGAGAQRYSQEHRCAVLNLDIGGGTTNLALFDRGKVVDTGCLNVGGRLVKLDKEGTLTYLSPVLRPYFDTELGTKPTLGQLEEMAEFLAGILESAVEGEPVPEGFLTEPMGKLPPEKILLCFSGGVADLLKPEERPRSALEYGDLGVLLGRAISRSGLFRDKERILQGEETIRATVIGAGSHTTELSGSTIYYRDVTFPMKNLPVACLEAEEEALPPEQLACRIREKLALFSAEEGPTVLGLQGMKNPKFLELCKLADGLALGLRPSLREGKPVIIAVETDMGKSLGQALHMLLPENGLLCLDGIRPGEGSYLDIGTPVGSGQVLPVVIKTLAIG